MPPGGHNCRPKSHPRRNLEREGAGGQRVPRNLTFPEVQSSPKNGPTPECKIADGNEKLCRTLATANTLSSIAPEKSLTHQHAGKTGSTGCHKNAVESDDSATRCERKPPEEKTRTYKGRRSGQGEGGNGTCTPQHARWSNASSPAPTSNREGGQEQDKGDNSFD